MLQFFKCKLIALLLEFVIILAVKQFAFTVGVH